MNLKTLFIGVCLIVFFLISVYFATNIASFESKSMECISQGGYCVDSNIGCTAQELMPHPDANCLVPETDDIDNSKVCCIRY